VVTLPRTAVPMIRPLEMMTPYKNFVLNEWPLNLEKVSCVIRKSRIRFFVHKTPQVLYLNFQLFHLTTHLHNHIHQRFRHLHCIGVILLASLIVGKTPCVEIQTDNLCS
jgi:hypothetical protein